MRMRIRLFFAWYDFWVGAYYDRKRTLYIGLLPMCMLKIEFKAKCSDCGKSLYPNEFRYYCGRIHCYKCKNNNEYFDEEYA